ncbi:peptidoglycan recognition protein family protein [Candidatus Clostridium radicumherbarum]|uniref:N-acetylmuramoyl-L-alanine amidase family protein n=1 Tax=Candidatus Clostridium radicumherbarum TaxID=3381662 RepID=A0ABW8TRT3_9CLOT
MSYEIIQKYISKNRSGQALTAIGMVLHDTDDKGATAQNEQSYFNNNNVSASAHAFIDWSSIIETVPDNEVAWGSGPTSNHKFLQVELCVPTTHDVTKFNEVWNRAVWYFAYKFVNKLNVNTITKDNLMSHAEVSNKWHETDHQDPIAYFNEYGKTVDQFRSEVQVQINIILGKGVSDMKKIVVYYGDADVFAALIVSQKNQCPLMSKADFVASGLQADQVIEIGGKPNSTRYSTFKDAANLV